MLYDLQILKIYAWNISLSEKIIFNKFLLSSKWSMEVRRFTELGFKISSDRGCRLCMCILFM